jgi:peptidoglycan/LPS O-acetylase OafA/YrhL
VNRNPMLDGWRGIAIALVLFDHIQDSLLHHYARSWSSTGYHGVTIFFVLSGFLITSKLLEGPISFRRFYLRRFFRLMPAAWIFLFSLLLLSWLTRNRFTSLAEVAACIFFCRNFFGQMGVAGHFWSLSVEEQFYLVWPVTLLLAGSMRARWIVGLGAVCCAVFRFLSWSKYSQSFPTGPTFLHADGLLVGCLLALLLADERIRGIIARWSKYLALPASFTLILCMYLQSEKIALFPEVLSIACLIAATTLHPTSIFSRPFAFQPLAWLGTVSYSVYIWQGLFMPFRTRELLPHRATIYDARSQIDQQAFWFERWRTRGTSD